MTRVGLSRGFHTPRRTSDVWDETQKSEIINDKTVTHDEKIIGHYEHILQLRDGQLKTENT